MPSNKSKPDRPVPGSEDLRCEDPSHMTTAIGVQPERKRGYERVAAIMRTGVEVFMEKGFDAATMTEIATRSGTAIASLYRFFPSKEALADALLLQYEDHAMSRLAELRE